MQNAEKTIVIVLVGILCSCHDSLKNTALRDARTCYEQALEAFDSDSVRLGEQLVNEAIRLAQQQNDLHTLYLAQLRLAESLAPSNSQAALDMAKQALETYKRQPDSPRNHIIILDYVGTYASQLAFNTDSSFDEALDFTHQAYRLALASRDSLGNEQVCQTLTSLANIYWAKDEYSTALGYAREAEACATPELQLGVQQVLARCLVSCDSLTAAEAVYRAMQPGEDIQAAYIIQSNLAKLALKRSDNAAAEEAIDDAFADAEELYYKTLQQKEDYYRNALLQERENERLRFMAALHRQALWGGLLIVLLIAALAALLITGRMRSQARQRLAEVWRRKHEVDESIHQAALRKQEALLHEQAEAAQREQLQQRDGMVAFLQDFILQRSAVIQKLGESAERHVSLSAHEWAEVERTLDVIDGRRFTRLRQLYPELREEDVQLCILTRLRLTNRAIGNIYGLTISAVQHRKLKLKKDIFGENNPDTPFEQVLERI